MKRLNLLSFVRPLAGAFFIALMSAGNVAAQWQVPDHSVPIGRGAGTGFKNAAPGAVGGVLTSNGESADPTFKSTATYYPQCDTTGVVDCSSEINAQIGFAQALKGGRIQLPCGLINVNAGIVIPPGNVDLAGCGSMDFLGTHTAHVPNQIGDNGTYLYQTTTSAAAVTISAGANGVTIHDLACTQLQPADAPGWTPTAYQACFRHIGALDTSAGVSMRRILCWGVYKCYESGGVSGPNFLYAPRNDLDEIRADCYFECFTIVASSDVDKITNVQVWPYASANSPNKMAYTAANLNAFHIFRQDNPHYVNIFVYGARIGFNFDSVLGGYATSVMVTNYDCDICYTGIQASASGAGFIGGPSYQLTNVKTQSDWNGSSGTAGSRGIVFLGDYATLQLANYNTVYSSYEGIYSSGANNNISVTNWKVDGWNMANNSSPLIFCGAATSKCDINGVLLQTGGNGAATASGSGATNLPIARTTATANQWVTNIGADGVQTKAQPSCANLSTAGTACTAATGTSGHTVPFLDGANTWANAQTFTTAPVFSNQAGTRTALGLGTAATQNTGTSGANVPLLNGVNTWSGNQVFSANVGIGAGAGSPANPLDIVDSIAGAVVGRINNTNSGASAVSRFVLQSTAGLAQFEAFSAAQGGNFNWSWTGASATQFIAASATGQFSFLTGASPTQKFAVGPAGHLSSGGSIPSVGTCGTSPSIRTGSTDTVGQITTGSTATTSCVITFATAYAAAPSCVATPEGAANSGLFVTGATGSLTLTYSSATSLKINYVCYGS
jgi:hypothetical protein